MEQFAQPHMTPSKPLNETVFIVLSYNGVDDTIACLESLYACHDSGADVIVVDNNSIPSVDNVLRTRFTNIELITLPENLGWAGGNNVGVKLALERGYKWICLLNNDTVFPDGHVKTWTTKLSSLPAALVHPWVYYWDEPGTAQLKEGYDTNDRKISGAEEWNGCTVMKYAYGACLAVHREIFERVGVFDERLFLQLEETDFYNRATNAGYRAICAPFIKVFHKESRAFGGKVTPGKTYYTVRNSFLLIEKHKGALGDKREHLKRIYWKLCNTAANDGYRLKARGVFGLSTWLLSDSPYAIASRYGFIHYLTRKFGKIPPELSDRIKKRTLQVGRPVLDSEV